MSEGHFCNRMRSTRCSLRLCADIAYAEETMDLRGYFTLHLCLRTIIYGCLGYSDAGYCNQSLGAQISTYFDYALGNMFRS